MTETMTDLPAPTRCWTAPGGGPEINTSHALTWRSAIPGGAPEITVNCVLKDAAAVKALVAALLKLAATLPPGGHTGAPPTASKASRPRNRSKTPPPVIEPSVPMIDEPTYAGPMEASHETV